jgi:hypothetical protein
MAAVCRLVFSGVVVMIAATAIGFGQGPAQKPSSESATRAEQVLVEARKALGGDKLAAVKTLAASGRTRRVRGDNLVPIEFEILVELPDKYVRVDEFPAEDTDPTSSGFNGDALIQIPPPPAAPPAGRGMPPPGGPGAPAGGPGAPPGERGAPPADPPGATAPAGRTPPPQSGPPAAPPAASGPGQAAPPAGPPAAGSGTPPAPGATPPGPGATGPGMAPQGARGPMPGGGRGPAMDPRRARIATLKQDFARLAIGLFAASPAYPLSFSWAALAEAPQGRADVLEAKGEGGFALRVFIHSETRLPIMVTWNTPPTNVIVTVPGQPAPKSIAPGAVVVTGPPAPPANAPKEETEKYTKEVLALRTKAQATPVEHRLYFADYREVDGVRLPFRLRRAIGTETTEETTFDRFRINPRIDPRKFEAVK